MLAHPDLSRLLNSHKLLALVRPSTKIALIKRFTRDSPPQSILDIGCGVYSPTYFATAFPRSKYVGIDSNPPLCPELPSGFQIIRADVTKTDLGFLADESFDLVVLSHVLEHLESGLSVVRLVCPKLRPGGTVFLAYPTAESVHFPHRRGTLNFYDDPTHIRVIETAAVCSVLNQCGLDVLEAARTRTVRGLLRMFPEVLLSPTIGGITGPMFWDLYGFEEHVVGRKWTR